MAEQENVQLIQQVYEDFGRGDIPAILNILADDIDWHVPGPTDIPTRGTRRGREQVAQFFTEVGETFDFEQFEPREFIAQGDVVVVLGYSRGSVKSTGRAIEGDWSMVFNLREGKVVRFRDYEDTNAFVAAYRGT